jgi:hypothetical protein
MILTMTFIFGGIITGHYYLIHFYASYCAPSLVSAVFSAGSPLCQFVNYVQFRLAQEYVYLWAAAGVTLIAWIVRKIGCSGRTPVFQTLTNTQPEDNHDHASGPTFEVLDHNHSRSSSSLQTAALVDQIVRWRIVYPQLTLDSPQLQEQLAQDDDAVDEDDDTAVAAVDSPCYVYSRQQGQHNNAPVVFNLSMVGDGDVPPEESFYNEIDGMGVEEVEEEEEEEDDDDES